MSCVGAGGRQQGVLAGAGLVVGEDMASCARQRCLYVADSGRPALHRVSVDAPGNTDIWPLDDRPSSLSVTRLSTSDQSPASVAGQSRPPTVSGQLNSEPFVLSCG